jgi:2-amino-1-hydroxyethylphosphonate dioxygenase (glycine-forming)
MNEKQISFMNEKQIGAIADEIIHLYIRYGGDDYIGEPVSQLEHMSQSAMLAQEEGYEEEVILAAFLHDIGHICRPGPAAESMAGYGVIRHEKVGADYLRAKGFSERLARLVESHVQAKRYLTSKFPKYYDLLSPASKQTLECQGGRMTATEADAFEQHELFSLSIRMRRWDELAKKENQPVADLAFMKQMMIRHLKGQ